jgi:hypothetical protein
MPGKFDRRIPVQMTAELAMQAALTAFFARSP